MAKKTGKYSEDEILDLYLESVENPLDLFMNEKEQYIMFQELSKVEGFTDCLHSLIGDDLKRHFKGTNDIQRAQVRGAYSRAIFFLAMTKKVRDIKEMDTRRLKRTESVVA